MSRLRIIPRLDIKGPNLIKGIRLEGLRVVNTEGVIRANALIERDGSIFLEGGSAAITAREGISIPGATRSR